MQTEPHPKPTLPLLALLALASVLGVAVAIALAGVAMLLAAPAYAGEGSLLLERRTGMAEAELVFAETESEVAQAGMRVRVVEEFHNPFAEQLAGVYLRRLPANAVLESLTFTRLSADVKVAARPALFTLRQGRALVERTAEIGPGEMLLVELEYRTPSAPGVLAARATCRSPS